MKKFGNLNIGDIVNVYSKDGKNFITILSKKKITKIIRYQDSGIAIALKGDSSYMVDKFAPIMVYTNPNSDKDIILSTEELSNVPWPEEKEN